MFKSPRRSHYVICDDCGRKRYADDTVIVNDKYNLFNGMVICREHYEKSNPSLWPDRSYERPLKAQDKLRPETADQYVINEFNDQLPSIPRNINFTVDSLSGNLIVMWDAPDSMGSGGITGYQITRANPQLSYQFTVEDNTGTNVPFYIDLTADPSEDYTYQVAAINSAGIGPFSDLGYYPTKLEKNTVLYLAASQNHFVLRTGSGQLITVRH